MIGHEGVVYKKRVMSQVMGQVTGMHDGWVMRGEKLGDRGRGSRDTACKLVSMAHVRQGT